MENENSPVEGGRYKYPSTPHLPWSPGLSQDDIKLSNTKKFENQIVVVTEKMDGENTSMYTDHIHARSLDSGYHPSRTWVKQLWAQIRHDIPKGWRICGENLYARHSIAYENLPSFFEVFSVWNEKNECLSWENTLEWCQLLGLNHVPVLYHGPWDENVVRASYNPEQESNNKEGYVVRVAQGFPYKDFAKNMAKYVRANHVQTSNHWMFEQVVPNGLNPLNLK